MLSLSRERGSRCVDEALRSAGLTRLSHVAWPGHAPPYGQGHPWTDPLAPQDYPEPRPDYELQVAGPLAPRPEDFPYTEEGRRDYYAAVRATAWTQMAVQHEQAQRAAQAAHGQSREKARVRAEQEAFLLLLP
jgi:hypothetical protein